MSLAASPRWYGRYDPQVSPEIAFESIPVYELLARSAAEHPNRPAVSFMGTTTTYKQLHRRAGVLARALSGLGLGPGDNAAIMLPNIPQTVTAFYAVLLTGARVVMVNPLYTEREIAHQLADCAPKLLICLDLLWPKIDAVREKSGLEKIVVTRIADGLAFPLSTLAAIKTRLARRHGQIPYDGTKILAYRHLTGGHQPLPGQVRDPGQTAVIQYTGGTTGTPKGAALSHISLVANTRQAREILHAVGQRPERFLAVLPFFHIYGLTVCLNLPVSMGACVLPVPKFEPAGLLEIIAKQRPSIFPGAPALYAALTRQKDLARYDLRSIRYLVSGSAPMPPALTEKFKKITGAEIIEGYGLTEASPVTHFNPLIGMKKIGSIGIPLPGTLAKIASEDGRELPPGEPGELLVKGPQVMTGYLGREEETRAVLKDGWLATGDIAVMDEDGYFRIVDRKKDLIITGGFNVYPREIEETLMEHPGVREAGVVGVEHPVRGQSITAYVVPADGASPTKEDLAAFCKTRLAPYKRPKRFELVAELPKTSLGKILRRDLKLRGQA